jgi:hypothetical protein
VPVSRLAPDPQGRARRRYREALALAVMTLAISACATSPIETPDDQPVRTRVVEFVKRHPVATWVAAGVIAGSIAASSNHRDASCPPGPTICCKTPESCR